MLLRMIDGEMNVRIFFADFPRNCEMETVATCSMIDGNGSNHGIAPSFFEEMTRCRRQNIAGDDQTTLMVHRNSANIAIPSAFTSVYVCAIATVVSWLTVAAVATHPHRRISKR